MTDIEISKALALAIGWKEPYGDPDVQIVWTPGGSMHVEVWFGGVWRTFDYRDWNVIGPIAQRYHAFPSHYPRQGGWISIATVGDNVRQATADTPQKAIALAVIGAKESRT